MFTNTRFRLCKYTISLACPFKRWETMLLPQHLMQEWQETGCNILFMTRHMLSVSHRERWRLSISSYPACFVLYRSPCSVRSSRSWNKDFQEKIAFSWDTFGVLTPWSAIHLSDFWIEPCNGHWDLWFYGVFMMKQILNDIHDADVSVVTLFGEATLWSVSSMRSSKMIKCLSLGSRVSKSANPCWKSTPSTVPYKSGILHNTTRRDPGFGSSYVRYCVRISWKRRIFHFRVVPRSHWSMDGPTAWNDFGSYLSGT